VRHAFNFPCLTHTRARTHTHTVEILTFHIFTVSVLAEVQPEASVLHKLAANLLTTSQQYNYYSVTAQASNYYSCY